MGASQLTTNKNAIKEFPKDFFLSYFEYRDGHFFLKERPRYYILQKGDKIKEIDNGKGYKYISLKQKKYYVHRLVFFYFKGYFPKYVDHINGDRSDNRIENLRECSHSENHGNRKPKKKPRGVFYNRKHKNWKVRIYTIKGHFHGTFKTKKEAILVYNEKAVLFFGSFARLNKC